MKSYYQYSKYSIIFGFLIFAFSSCVEDVPNINLPVVESKLVVTSFISPNDSVRVKVSKSLPLNYNQQTNYYDNQYLLVDNAVVVITRSSDNLSETIPYIPEKGQYVLPPSTFSIDPGQQYLLNVSAPGLKSVTATTIVPSSFPNLVSIKIDTITTQSQWEGENNEIIITGVVKDAVGEANYYSVGILINEEYYDPYYDTTYTWSWYDGGTLFSDVDRDGEEISFKKNLYYKPEGEILFKLLSTDENYFRYHNSYYNFVGDNPFSEPSPVFSNIEGGLGVFSSCLISTVNINENR